MLNYLRVRVGDEALAEELTATTFAQAFAKRQQLRNVAAFPGGCFALRTTNWRSTSGAGPIATRSTVDFDFLVALPSSA
ncbi:hypothetical protein [Candidatus Amarolinea dominans]|uniref:hypothetical protein n=1 Tax=Candidatus Amarolinea dominans TaxID=3140696 RepID=UPI00313554EC|nr:hypothetical protein [Anaerolineae bacterium]